MNFSSRTVSCGAALIVAAIGTSCIVAMLFITGCVAGGGGGYVDGDVYYGADDERPWFHDGVWLNGSRGYHEAPHYHYGGDVYINPPRVSHPARAEHSAPARSAPTPHAEPARPSGGHDRNH